MTRKLGPKILVIEAEKPRRCEDCGVVAELRPYGRNAAFVCFDCAMKDEPNARAMFIKRMGGDG